MNNNPARRYYKDEKLLEEIGKNLRAAREDKKISIEQLANEIGVDYSQVGRMELGKVNFSISTLYRIARALKADAKVLLP